MSKYLFECADCQVRRKSWDGLQKHLQAKHPTPTEGYAVAYVYPQDTWNS